MSDPDPTLVARLRSAGCVFAEDEAAIIEDAAAPGPEREALVTRRVAGDPLEHLVGWAAFDGLRITVAPGVFVPRQRSLLLVDLAEAHLAGITRSAGTVPVVLDLCCGSGALATALAHRRPGLRVHACDVDPRAVACAAGDLALAPAPTMATTSCGDLDDTVPPDLTGRVDVLLANAPYVPTAAIATMPPEARDHEPGATLDGGPDGLDVLRRVAALAPRWLRPGGVVLSEVATEQVPATLGALDAAGLRGVARPDEERGATAVVGTA